MNGLRRRRPSPALVISIIALVVALSGTGYAAFTLPRNSVTSAQIANGQVRHADLAKNAVTTRNVKDGSLLSSDFKPGQLAAGPKGDAGQQGPKGDAGATGPRGPSFGAAKQVTELDLIGCGEDATTLTLPVTITNPSRIYASLSTDYRNNGGPVTGGAQVQLLSGSTIVAVTPRVYGGSADVNHAAAITSAGVMTTGGDLSVRNTYVVPAGSYTLLADIFNSGTCTGGGFFQDPNLSYILLGDG